MDQARRKEGNLINVLAPAFINAMGCWCVKGVHVVHVISFTSSHARNVPNNMWERLNVN